MPVPPPVHPFSDDELRKILIRLYDLGAAWATIDAQRQSLENLEQWMARERALSTRELDLEQKRRELAERERDVEKQRADFFETKSKLLEKKPGFGCTLKKLVTLGRARCL